MSVDEGRVRVDALAQEAAKADRYKLLCPWNLCIRATCWNAVPTGKVDLSLISSASLDVPHRHTRSVSLW